MTASGRTGNPDAAARPLCSRPLHLRGAFFAFVQRGARRARLFGVGGRICGPARRIYGGRGMPGGPFFTMRISPEVA